MNNAGCIGFGLAMLLTACSGEQAHLPADCRVLPPAATISDMTTDDGRGVAYLTYLNHTPNPEGKLPTGTVMLVDLNAAEPRVRAALVSEPPDFRPTALALYVPKDGARRLIVAGAETIYVFEQTPSGEFALVNTVKNPLLANPTAVTVTGPDQFAVTSIPPPPKGWSAIFTRTNATVVSYDGTNTTTRVVEAGMLPASSVPALSAHGRTLVMGSTPDHQLLLCDTK